MVTKKLTDWLAGLVSEIPKRASDNDARLVNLTAIANLKIRILYEYLLGEQKSSPCKYRLRGCYFYNLFFIC